MDRNRILFEKYGDRFQIDEQFNRDNYAAVYDRHHNRLYHLHRGTVNNDDLYTDSQLAIGRLSSTDRYRQTEALVNGAKLFYQGAQHTHIGHSLGGTLADTFARQGQGDTSVAFNMGSSPFAGTNPATEQHQHFRIGTDFVSRFADPSGTQVLPKKPNRLDTLLARLSNPFTSGIHFQGAGLAHTLYNMYDSHFLKNFSFY